MATSSIRGKGHALDFWISPNSMETFVNYTFFSLKALTNEIDRQKDELQSCQQMSIGLIELNRNNKDGCNSITTRLHKITSSLVELENALEDKQRKFGSVRKYLDKYHQLKIPVDEYLAATDARLDELTPFGLDVETGEKHQKELEVSVGEICFFVLYVVK